MTSCLSTLYTVNTFLVSDSSQNGKMMAKNLGLYSHTSNHRKERKKRILELVSVCLSQSLEVMGPYLKDTQDQMSLRPMPTLQILGPGMKSKLPTVSDVNLDFKQGFLLDTDVFCLE